MKKLTCEMCGSTDLIKQDGVFVCQSCGCKYSIEEAKKMMIEGTVEVHGTVRIDNTDSITELVKRGFISIEDSEWEKAEECFNQVLSMDAECAEAYLGLSMVEKRKFSIKELVLTDILENKHYKRAKQFAGEKLLAELYEAEENRTAKEKLQAEMATYRSKGLCQHCGGEFKGLFVTRCTNCNKLKDYR